MGRRNAFGLVDSSELLELRQCAAALTEEGPGNKVSLDALLLDLKAQSDAGAGTPHDSSARTVEDVIGSLLQGAFHQTTGREAGVASGREAHSR